ncbi:SNF2-like protein [Actinobaculum suis]|uniref:SNF2-like protein n=1 Tax=Actinobaculum suis TaxID=1657 RepID=A0A7Z8Y7U4_9ACTO|nr:helicase-related protein [Actinobaculum suis]VDG75794.1 SNF2-like protein [Actinobaculum suis]
MSSPSGFTARVDANIAAIETLSRVEGRPTPAQQEILAAWSGWGGLSRIFDERETSESLVARREKLHALLGEDGYRAARRGVLDAHYTAPAYSRAIWAALTECGATAGRGLEPGCGAGSFISNAPADMAMTGVELDPTTGQIAQVLNPDDEIRIEGFEKTQLPAVFDVAVGNVPFGDIRLQDRAHNPGNHSIHNHFIIKSLDLVKAGGYVALLTSSFTMDSRNPAARRDMYERADLVAALRLPSGAHQSTAGTQVVTDLLVFRRRAEGDTPGDDTWTLTAPFTLTDQDGNAHDHVMNTYWAAHPTHVLGEMSLANGMYGSQTLTVTGVRDKELATRLQTTLTDILRMSPLAYHPVEQGEVTLTHVELDQPVGSLRATANGGEKLSGNGTWEPIRLAKKHVPEFHAIMELMENAKELVALESVERGYSAQLEDVRSHVRTLYMAYTQKYGPLNRNEKRATIRRKKDKDGTVHEEETLRVIYPPAVVAARRDPRAAVTFGMEKFDDETGTARPADILSSRQIYARYTPKGADSLDDALQLSLEARGKIDTQYIAYMLGTNTDPTEDLLREGLIFRDPDAGLVIREEYLSGNVRRKLDAAHEAVLTDNRYEANVAALTEVLPPDIPRHQIATEIGAQWIETEDYQDFLHHLLRTSKAVVRRSGISDYSVTLNGAPSDDFLQTTKWGTPAMRASEIFRRLLSSKEITVKREDEEGNLIILPGPTEAAKDKAEQIQAEFSRWIWSDAERADRLQAKYNRQFNSLVGRDYSRAGDRLRLPGLASSITLYEHQKSAVARMIGEPTAGLFHEVGAGKTLEMICGVMEQKRLGLINKPMAVVPNHLVGQFENEWLQAYPAARVLAIDTANLQKEGRAEFFAQATTSQWDVIIASQSAFTKLALSADSYEQYARHSLDQYDRLLEFLRENGEEKSVVSVEKARRSLETTITREIDKQRIKQDKGALTFEQLGVDYLVVDEAHSYKNLTIGAGKQTADLLSNGSGRATDMDMKINWLRDNVSPRCVTFATATPVANSMGEMFVMTHYLRPDLLVDAGVDVFDAWAKQFAVREQNVELNAAGQFTVKERFARFQNVPELLAMWHTFADVKLAADLDLKVPELAKRSEDGKRQPVTKTVDLGPAMAEFQERLDMRAQMISARHVDRHADNWLAVTGDGTTFALDDRLFSPERAERALGDMDTSDVTERKVDVVAAQILDVFNRTKDNVYVNDDGEEDSVRGALQIVFCDQGTPKKNGFSVYEELRELLVEGGIPREKIAFIHDAKTTVEKTQLFLRARTGGVNVIIGSTEKMGTGANMQDRAVAIHHVDAPWRPADITQRDGRIIRQGNQNKEIESYRYVTLHSLDAYRWQTLERKQSFISQVMRGKFDGREVEDISQAQMDYAESKAIATADPLIIRQVELKNKVSRLSRLQGSWESNRGYNLSRATMLKRQAANLNRLRDTLKITLAEYTGKDFRMTIISGDRHMRSSFTDRREAAEFLKTLAHQELSAAQPLSNGYGDVYQARTPYDFRASIIINGVILKTLSYQPPKREPTLLLTPAPFYYAQRLDMEGKTPWNQQVVKIPVSELRAPTHNTIIRIENLVNDLETRLQKPLAKIQELEAEIEKIQEYGEQTSPYQDELTDTRDALDHVNKAIAARSQNGPEPTRGGPTISR